MRAEKAAMASPKASSEGVLSGKDSPSPSRLEAGLVVVVSGEGEVEMSTWEIRKTPARLATTPRSLRQVNFSVRVMAPMSRVQTLEVEVRMVVEATVVY
jgi:hypothetical protein